MKKNDEFDEVGVRLLPERLFAAAEKVVQKRSDVIRQSVGVQIVVERVVAVFGIEADFNVILDALVTREDVFCLGAKIAFYLQD